MKNILELAKESFYRYRLSTMGRVNEVNAVPDSAAETLYTTGFDAGYVQAVRSTPPLNTSDGELCNVCELCYQPKPRVPHANGWVWVYQSWICNGCYRRTTGAGLKLKDHPGGCFAAGRPDPRKTVPHNPDSPVKCGCCGPGVTKCEDSAIKGGSSAAWVDELVPESLKPAFQRVLALIGANATILAGITKRLGNGPSMYGPAEDSIEKWILGVDERVGNLRDRSTHDIIWLSEQVDKFGTVGAHVTKLREDLELLNSQIANNAETAQSQIDKLQDKIHRIMDGYAAMLDHLVMADVKSTDEE